MLFVEAFRNNRLDYLKQSQHLQSTLDQNFSLCSNQYIKKYPKCRQLQPTIMSYSRDPTLFLFAQKNTVRRKKTSYEFLFLFSFSLTLEYVILFSIDRCLPSRRWILIWLTRKSNVSMEKKKKKEKCFAWSIFASVYLTAWVELFDRSEMNPIRKCFEVNKHQIAAVFGREEELSVQGQRLRNQPESFWLYYSHYVRFSFIECAKNLRWSDVFKMYSKIF